MSECGVCGREVEMKLQLACETKMLMIRLCEQHHDWMLEILKDPSTMRVNSMRIQPQPKEGTRK